MAAAETKSLEAHISRDRDVIRKLEFYESSSDSKRLRRFHVAFQMSSMLRYQDCNKGHRVEMPIPKAAFKNLSNAKSCQACGSTKDKQQKCSGCGSAFYCSRLCQVNDWKQGHEAECKRAMQHSPLSSD